MTRAGPRLLAARWILGPDGAWIEGGGLVLERGRVAELLRSPRELRAAGTPEDLGDAALTPGYVDAHAHLELTGLGGVLPRADFTAWIRALIAARAARAPADLVEDARRGAARLLATGTTCVGDVDSTGAIAQAARRLPLRVRRYREVLDAGDAARAASALAALDRPRERRLLEGVSPHAPYTVSAALWSALRRRLARAQVAVHWAETAAEAEWLERGGGPFAALLRHPPGRSGLDAIEAAGLLTPRTALIHGNHATAEERGRVARAGSSLVHCPGTHAFFGRAPFDAAAWLRAGVPLALGTDSLASNADLDLRREMALLRAAQPGLDPRDVLVAATAGGARALGLAGRVGTLAPGAWADLTLHAVRAASGRAVEEALTCAAPEVLGVWIAGRPVALGAESSAAGVGKAAQPAQNSATPSRP